MHDRGGVAENVVLVIRGLAHHGVQGVRRQFSTWCGRQQKENYGDKPFIVRLLTHLAGLPKHGTPRCFLPLPRTYAPPKSIDVEIERPRYLAGGERTTGNEFGW